MTDEEWVNSFLFFSVAKEDCPSTKNAEVCGVDNKAYPSLFHFHKKFAYIGPCRPKQCTGDVCGSDGTTYSSPCYARARSVRIDYYEKCFAEE